MSVPAETLEIDISLTLKAAASAVLLCHAQKRDCEPIHVLADLIETILMEDMVDAVLDDDAEMKLAEPPNTTRKIHFKEASVNGVWLSPCGRHALNRRRPKWEFTDRLGEVTCERCRSLLMRK